MAGIQGNYNHIINQTVLSALSNNQNNAAAQQVSADTIYNLFFKNVKTKGEFKKKIRNTLKNLNGNLKDNEIDEILDSLDLNEQPPFCASYSEEGVSQELNLKDNVMRSDIYDIFLAFYNDLYDEAKKSIQ